MYAKFMIARVKRRVKFEMKCFTCIRCYSLYARRTLSQHRWRQFCIFKFIIVGKFKTFRRNNFEMTSCENTLLIIYACKIG